MTKILTITLYINAASDWKISLKSIMIINVLYMASECIYDAACSLAY